MPDSLRVPRDGIEAKLDGNRRQPDDVADCVVARLPAAVAR
ncbi:MAG: hypothetical protein AAGD07_01860 [Planctomycetota bacterium]